MPGQLNPALAKTKIKKKRNIWRNLLLMFLLLFAVLALIDATGVLFYAKIARLSCVADTAVVMGAAQYNGVPSPVFMRRLEKAHELYNSGCVNKIVVTGGKLNDDVYSEGESGATYLKSKGIPEQNIKFETSSKTSYENLAFSKALIEKNKITIISDDYHVYRSSFLARLLGYKVEVAPVFRKQGHSQNHRRIKQLISELMKMMAYHFGIIR